MRGAEKSIAALAQGRQSLRMSNRLSRDTEDAAKVLAALRDKYHPRETLNEKLSASEDLRAKLVNVVTGLRQWSVKRSGDDTLITLHGAGSVRVRTDLETGQVSVSADEDTFHAPALEYDVVSHEWVGSEHDTDLVQPPGEKLPRKSAIVALTEQIARLLTSPAKRIRKARNNQQLKALTQEPGYRVPVSQAVSKAARFSGRRLKRRRSIGARRPASTVR